MNNSVALKLTVVVGVLFFASASCQNPEQDMGETELADFWITVQSVEGEIRMTCEKGCAWTELTWSPSSMVQPVNEYGMASSSDDD